MFPRASVSAVIAVLLLAACNPPAESPAQDGAGLAVPDRASSLEGQLAEDARRLGTFPTLTGELPAIIAHRGASGYFPEHTEAAFQLANDQAQTFWSRT